MRQRTQLNLTYILKEWIREQLQITEHRLELVNCVIALSSLNDLARMSVPPHLEDWERWRCDTVNKDW